MYPREKPCSLPMAQALADLTEPRTLEGVRSLTMYILAGMLADHEQDRMTVWEPRRLDPRDESDSLGHGGLSHVPHQPIDSERVTSTTYSANIHAY